LAFSSPFSFLERSKWGRWWLTPSLKEEIYSSSLELSILKNYYSFQLRFFCNDWHWQITPSEISTYCTNRRDTDHTFYLSLKPQADGKVLVTQEDSWNEP
jgi:hypothetical protein